MSRRMLITILIVDFLTHCVAIVARVARFISVFDRVALVRWSYVGNTIVDSTIMKVISILMFVVTTRGTSCFKLICSALTR